MGTGLGIGTAFFCLSAVFRSLSQVLFLSIPIATVTANMDG